MTTKVKLSDLDETSSAKSQLNIKGLADSAGSLNILGSQLVNANNISTINFKNYVTGSDVTVSTLSVDGNGLLTYTGTIGAPTFQGALSGNATTAGKLQTPRTINGVSFDGSANIAIETGALPAGSMVLGVADTDGSGMLLADARAVSRTTYAALFAAIDTRFGAGDGSTTFNLPQMTLPGKQFISGTSLPAVRYVHTATILPDGRILVTGGWDGAVRAEAYFGVIFYMRIKA